MTDSTRLLRFLEVIRDVSEAVENHEVGCDFHSVWNWLDDIRYDVERLKEGEFTLRADLILLAADAICAVLDLPERESQAQVIRLAA